ncbi:MAG: AhpC/TSA family protein [Candidatus Koribacter versatilis]|uniref:thioredoxin-dependent peroxiredoxin n=1 Tax=Candidatus Korobacter versatilis TaxID=658062 RepID=A0A932ERS7_9BACT|nr:AhpC/TSA family protein [Candidatus Koribacter versatilis]
MEWRGSNPKVEEAKHATLAARLDAISRQVEELVPAAKLEPPRSAVRELIASGATAHALKSRDKAPNFELPDAHGRTFILADRLAQGPVVLVFYRGRWCPYCIAQLEELEKARLRFEGHQATIAAISPQKLQHSGFTAEQHGLRFAVLTDSGNRVARQYGVAWSLPDSLVSHYRGVFVNLENANAAKDWVLPVPATFVIAPDSTIVWSQVDADFRHRAEPAVMLDVVGKLLR